VNAVPALLLLASAIAGCGPLMGAGLAGPLAIERTNAGMEALGHGTLTIEESCAWLVTAEDRWLLVWPDGGTRWDGLTAEVVFTHHDGTEARLRDGMEVALGGGAISRGDGALFAGVDWVAPPAPGCDTDTRWHVSGVVDP
jgi:hypothetical protein